MYDGEDYVVVHKPAGVQVAPTVDNLLENVLSCTAQVCRKHTHKCTQTHRRTHARTPLLVHVFQADVKQWSAKRHHKQRLIASATVALLALLQNGKLL